MSGKQNKPQQQQQKRKADAPAAQTQQPKKQKDQSGAAAAAPQQQQGKKAAASKEQPKAAAKEQPKAAAKEQPKAAAAAAGKEQGKKGAAGKKAAAPEPEPEEEQEQGEDDDEEGEGGAVDEKALEAIEAIQPEQDAITAELDAFDEQQNAEIYAIQKKFLLKKRPVLAKRDQLIAKLPGVWKRLFSEHEVFAVQLEEIDHEILDNLTVVEVAENYSAPDEPKQQIISITITFTFTAGKHVKAGKFAKTFKFNDEKEALEGVAATKLPFSSAKFADEHKDSFFLSWYTSEGDDEGIIAAQDALTSELYVDPLQLYAHLAGGGSLKDLQEDGEGSDDDDDAMIFEEDDEDDEAPELADE